MPARRIRLTFVSTGESATAEMLDEEAPGVCRLVWEPLPIDQMVVHGMYSGAEVFALLENPKPPPAENLTQLPLPGEILYFYDPGINVTSARKPAAEICIVYGRGVTLRGPEGAPAYASLFARIPGDWKYDWREFASACRSVRHDGPRRLRIELA